MSMTKEAGAKYLYDNVQVPVFFDRVQQWGFAPSNAAEAQLMLKTAGELLLLKEAQEQQAQAEGQSFLQKAAAHVSKHVQTVYPNAFNPLPQQIASTAKAAAANPDIVAACMALQS
jgi:hypothetical protein